MKVYGIISRPEGFSEHSGLWPAVMAAGMVPVEFGERWRRWQAKSWTIRKWWRTWGTGWYGSGWNVLAPWSAKRAIFQAMDPQAFRFAFEGLELWEIPIHRGKLTDGMACLLKEH